MEVITRTASWQFLDLCSDGIAVLEHGSWKIVHLNLTLQKWLGEDVATLCQEAIQLVSPPDQSPLRAVLETLSSGERQGAAFEVTLAGIEQNIPVQIQVAEAEFGDETYLVLVCQKSRLVDPASTERVDPLTGLPDRNYLVTQLHRWLERARDGQFFFAVLFVDFDNFKDINDTRGHRVGDFVLGELARRLAACMRSEDIIARFGGDEFVVLIESVRNEDDCLPIIARIQETLRKPVPLVDGDVVISASIGLVVADKNVESVDELLHAADRAMYAAKRG